MSLNRGKVKLNGELVYMAENIAGSDTLKQVYRHFGINYPKFFKMDNLSKLGFLSSEILLADTDIKEKYKPERTGIILLNSSSSLETDEKHQESIDDRNNYFPSPSVFVYTLANIMAGEMAIRHKLRGENSVFVFEQFEPEFIYDYSRNIFKLDKADCLLGGWVESYHERMESFLFLVEQSSPSNSGDQAGENIIFDAKSTSQLFNESVLK
jgi:hypothetical protein